MTLEDVVQNIKKHLEQMTPAEREEMHEAQKRSFVRAEAGFGSDTDEAAYRKALREGDGETLDRLNKEADVRMATADKILDADKLNIVLTNLCDSIKYLQWAIQAPHGEREYYLDRSSKARKSAEKGVKNE